MALTEQERVRELVAEVVDLAGRADSATAHPNYQHEKCMRAWRKLTLALLVLGVPSADLKDAVDVTAASPVLDR